jgi:hypothetical protein
VRTIAVGGRFSDEDVERVQEWLRARRGVVVSPSEARLVILAVVHGAGMRHISVSGRDVATGELTHVQVSPEVIRPFLRLA